MNLKPAFGCLRLLCLLENILMMAHPLISKFTRWSEVLPFAFCERVT